MGSRIRVYARGTLMNKGIIPPPTLSIKPMEWRVTSSLKAYSNRMDLAGLMLEMRNEGPIRITMETMKAATLRSNQM